jgi:hypothetical protein
VKCLIDQPASSTVVSPSTSQQARRVRACFTLPALIATLGSKCSRYRNVASMSTTIAHCRLPRHRAPHREAARTTGYRHMSDRMARLARARSTRGASSISGSLMAARTRRPKSHSRPRQRPVRQPISLVTSHPCTHSTLGPLPLTTPSTPPPAPPSTPFSPAPTTLRSPPLPPPPRSPRTSTDPPAPPRTACSGALSSLLPPPPLR